MKLGRYNGTSSTGGIEFELSFTLTTNLFGDGTVEDQQISFEMNDVSGNYASITSTNTFGEYIIKGPGAIDPETVSYTHLTLPTIYSV